MTSEPSCGCVPRRMVMHVLDAAALILIQVIQGSILNYYMIAHYKSTVNPYFWFIADFAILFMFAATLAISYQYLTKVKFSLEVSPKSFYLSPKRINSRFPTSKLGILPLSYVSWIFYSVVNLSKVMVIFKSGIPYHLMPHEPFGPQLLQVTVALSGIIFLLLVEGHNWAPRGSPRYMYVTSVCGKTGIEILDTVSLLALLLIKETHKSLTLENALIYLEDVILILCSFNFFLPALALYKLSLSDVTCENLFLPMNVLYNFLHLCMIDVPFLAVRVYLWIHYNYNASIFLMKNIFGIIFAIRAIYPDVKELLHRRRHPELANSNGYAAPHADDDLELQPKDVIVIEENRNSARRAQAVHL